MFTVISVSSNRHHRNLPEHVVGHPGRIGSRLAAGVVPACRRRHLHQPPTSAPTWSARSKPASPKTPAQPGKLPPTTWATTSATGAGMAADPLRATRSPWLHRSSSASPRSTRSAPTRRSAHLPALLSLHWRGRADHRHLLRQAKEGETNALKPINKGSRSLVADTGRHVARRSDLRRRLQQRRLKCCAAAIGLVLAQDQPLDSITGDASLSQQEIAAKAETGPATVILAGTASGMESSVYAVLAIAIASVPRALGGGNLCSVLSRRTLRLGMLATTGVIVSETRSARSATTPPASPRASGEFHGEPVRIMVSLDVPSATRL